MQRDVTQRFEEKVCEAEDTKLQSQKERERGVKKNTRFSKVGGAGSLATGWEEKGVTATSQTLSDVSAMSFFVLFFGCLFFRMGRGFGAER